MHILYWFVMVGLPIIIIVLALANVLLPLIIPTMPMFGMFRRSTWEENKRKSAAEKLRHAQSLQSEASREASGAIKTARNETEEAEKAKILASNVAEEISRNNEEILEKSKKLL